jgi:uncharacterized protein with HEPN domain
MDKDLVYKEDIMGAILRIEEFVQGMTFEEFLLDAKTQSACLMQFIVIGETVNKLSEAYTSLRPVIEWQEIIATRNIIIHQYTKVDMKIVWHTIQTDVPHLKEIL